MRTSDSINELASAMVKVQAKLEGAKKDSSNPFFKSNYADLESVWIACREVLTSNGLAVLQGPVADGGAVVLATRLVHTSGQWMESYTPIKTKDDSPQAQGSGITYARRYALAAMVGVYQVDDDAEAAQGRPAKADGAKDSAIVASIKKDLENARTKEELKTVATGISKLPIPGPAKEELRLIYSARLEEL